jgi:hypothetical protein
MALNFQFLIKCNSCGGGSQEKWRPEIEKHVRISESIKE